MPGEAPYKLPLAPPETLGRRFQYAFLSLGREGGDYVINARAGYALFPGAQEYVELVKRAVDAIRGLEASNPPKGCRPSSLLGVDCCRLHGGPALYGAGRRYGKGLQGDYGLLTVAGLTRCSIESGRRRVAWSHAALSYAASVIDSGGPLEGVVDDLPWLAKATLFGKVRATGGGRRGPGEGYDLNMLGTILLGGSLAFLWSQRLGDSVVEFLLVPDYVHQGYAALRAIMLRRGLKEGVAARASRLAADLPVSLEAALALALAVEVAEAYKPAEQLAALEVAEELEKAATLVLVTPQRRPMLRSSIPLTTLLYACYERETLEDALAAAERARSPGVSRELQGIRDLAGSCINSMLLQSMHPREADHLSHCVRGLMAAAQQARDKGLPVAGLLERLSRRLALDQARMLRGGCP